MAVAFIPMLRSVRVGCELMRLRFQNDPPAASSELEDFPLELGFGLAVLFTFSK